MLKGVMRVDDAKRAVDAGVSAISVSNHGGNNLDGTPASIRALPAIAASVGDQVEVLLDGGIRRGSDVVKALALGARAVMLGRAYLWGLAAEGQPGVENVLDIMRSGIDSALMGLGKASIHDLTPTTCWSRRASPARLACPPRDRLSLAAGPGGAGGADEADVKAADHPGTKTSNCRANPNIRRTPGEFGLRSAGGFPQRAWDLNGEAAPRTVTRIDHSAGLDRAAWATPAR